MAELTVQKIDRDGITPTFAAAAAAGDSFVNNERTFVEAVNADGAATRTITIQPVVSKVQVEGHGEIPTTPKVITVPIGGRQIFEVETSAYGGKPVMTYDDETQLTIGVFEKQRGL